MTTTSLQDKIDALTNQLSTSDNSFDLLLRRAQLYHESNEISNMQQDISKAAQLTNNPKDRKRLEQTMKELAIGDKQYTMTVEELLETEMTLENARALKTKCFGKQVDQESLVKILDQFHKACTNNDPDGLAEELAATVGGARISQECARVLSEHVLRTWEDDNTESFKQLAAKYGANMYSILTHAAKDSREMVALYIDQVWNRNHGNVQANLRVLSANQPLFIQQFLATPTPFRHLLESLATNSSQLALVSQLVGAAQDPQNSSLLPDYNKGDKVPKALSRLQQECVRLVDSWVQSTEQKTRERGFLALAALYDAGVGGQLAGGVWKLPEWIEGIWDQAEFDSRETQRALLMLAEASSSENKVVEQMKQQGLGLVKALSKTDELKVKAEATAVLAKWSAIKGKDQVEDPLVLADSLIGQIMDNTAEGMGMDKTVEALGFMCLQPEIKRHVAGNESLLRCLVGNVTNESSSAALRFSTVMVIHNLTQYRPVLTEEQKRMEQLQKLNKAGGDKAKEEEKPSELESPQHVSERCRLVSKAGVVQVLAYVVQNKQRPTDGIKDAVAHILVSLATTPQLRGLIVQQGGAKALLAILTADALKPDSQQPRDRQIAHALAKIAISVPPHLAFADLHTVVLLLVRLLAPREDSSLLMKFEALLALTNLASDHTNGVREYMAGIDDFISIIETSMLSDHALVQRAATELLCNLVTSGPVFKRYSAESSPKDYRSHPLHLLVALSDVDNKQTRSAALGALAQLSESPRVCRYLFLVHPRASVVFKHLAEDDDDSGMKHRASVIWANTVRGLDPELVGKIRDDKELVGLLRRMREDGPDMVYFEATKYVLENL